MSRPLRALLGASVALALASIAPARASASDDLSPGDVVVADSRGPSPPMGGVGPGAVVRVDPVAGTQTVVAEGSFLEGGFRALSGVALDRDGTLLLTGLIEGLTRVGAVYRLDPASGNWSAVSVGRRLHSPGAIAIEPSGDMLVGSIDTGAIVRVSPDGKQSRLTRFASVEGITVGPDGAVWATDSLVAAVLRIDPDKGSWTLVSFQGLLVHPAGIIVAPDGSLLVVDENCCPGPAGPGGVLRIDPQTGAQTVVSSGGLFDRTAHGIALEASGDLLIAPRSGGVFRVDPSNGDQTPLSSGGALQESFGLVVVPDCGDGVLEPPLEQCDDGGSVGGDGCSADCRVELPDPVCIETLNASLRKVALAQGKAVSRCIKQRVKDGSSADACVAAGDAKVDKTQDQTDRSADKRCSAIPSPFGAVDAGVVNEAATRATTDLVYDLFAPDLDGPIAAGGDVDVASCQQSVVKAALKCQSVWLAEFASCQKQGLRAGSIDGADDLEDCVGADARGRIAKACAASGGKIAKAVDKTCAARGVDLSDAFPACGTVDAQALATCAGDVVDCRVCEALNEADRLSMTCSACP